jgi:large subunit ribosomal protein L22
MSKNTSRAIAKKLRISPRKLSLVANLIKGMKASHAVMVLSFCKKAISLQVKKCLLSAIANAENNIGLDIDNLVVKTSTVGKALVMKRHMPRAKGRGARINKFFSNLYITLEENEVS